VLADKLQSWEACVSDVEVRFSNPIPWDNYQQIFLLHVPLTSAFAISLLDGKEAPLTAVFSKMHESMDLPYLPGSFIWQMQVSQVVMLCWCPTEESGII
jgi:hypothetical protein